MHRGATSPACRARPETVIGKIPASVRSTLVTRLAIAGPCSLTLGLPPTPSAALTARHCPQCHRALKWCSFESTLAASLYPVCLAKSRLQTFSAHCNTRVRTRSASLARLRPVQSMTSLDLADEMCSCDHDLRSTAQSMRLYMLRQHAGYGPCDQDTATGGPCNHPRVVARRARQARREQHQSRVARLCSGDAERRVVRGVASRCDGQCRARAERAFVAICGSKWPRMPFY